MRFSNIQLLPALCVITSYNSAVSTPSRKPSAVASSTQPAIAGLPGWLELLPPITRDFVVKVGHVPLLPYNRLGASEVAELSVQAIAAYAAKGLALHAIMLSRVGPNVWHDSPASAMPALEELEETAKLACLRPDTKPLADAEIEELRQAFNAIW